MTAIPGAHGGEAGGFPTKTKSPERFHGSPPPRSPARAPYVFKSSRGLFPALLLHVRIGQLRRRGLGL